MNEVPGKPVKPTPDFPLFPHNSGRWAKKIRGKMHYFGPWRDPAAALAKYEASREALHSGLPAERPREALTVGRAVDAFLGSRRAREKAGELSSRTLKYYERVGREVRQAFGAGKLVAALGPEDFTRLRARFGRTAGYYRMTNLVGYTRGIFKHALECGLIDRPVQFGPDFRRTPKKTIRLHRAAQGARAFAAADLLRMIGAAGPMLRGMILLGINCGFGNTDCATLPAAAVDLAGGWVDHARPKTGVGRRCPLWPETAAALREWLAVRPAPMPGYEPFLFLGPKGAALDSAKRLPFETGILQLMNRLGVKGGRGMRFYALRHTFRTVADEARDQPAADYVMGHESPHMSTHYRERISDERLRAVAEVVRKWLHGGQVDTGCPPAESTPAPG